MTILQSTFIFGLMLCMRPAGAHSLDQLSNLPKDLRTAMAADGVRTGRSILHHSVSTPTTCVFPH